VAKTSVAQSVALAILLISEAASLHAQKLSGPLAQLQIDASIVHRGKPVPKWENGWLLSYDNGYSAPARVSALDRSGKQLMDAPIALPDGTSVMIRDIAATPKGTIAITVTGQSGPGAGSAFITWVAPSGQIAQVVRTTPFAATSLAFGKDGTLWALGRQVDPGATVIPHPILRQYGTDGSLLQSVLDSQSFKTADQMHPATAGYSHLVVGQDRLGIYSETANEWIEVSFSGQVLGQWTGIGSHTETRVTGVALTPDGQVFVTTQGQ
jgi:hypothetical protein